MCVDLANSYIEFSVKAVKQDKTIAVNFFEFDGLPVEAYPFFHSTLSFLSITISSTQLQSLNTDVCGVYCVDPELSVAREVSTGTFVSYGKKSRIEALWLGE